MYDVIVVGARCAGAPAALLLARAGYRVLVLERAAVGTDTLSTHFVHQPGVAALARWGLLDALKATGCPPLETARYEVAGIRLDGRPRGVDGQRAAYSPRRYVLDALLAGAAADAGAELRERCRVTGLVRDGTGRVAGVTGTHRGRTFTEHARLVIGADGMRSTVADLTGAPYTVRNARLTCAYYGYWTGMPAAPAAYELYERAGGWVAAVATHGGATLVLTYFPQARFDEVRADAVRHHAGQVRATAPALYERMRAGEQAERLRGTGDQRNFFRRAAGPGWALIGDAAHHKDSITARGITDAFTQVETLVRTIGDDLAGDPARLDAALEAYADGHHAALAPGYATTLDVARLAPPPGRRLALLRAVRSDPELTSTYFDTFAGSADITALYTPALLSRLAA